MNSRNANDRTCSLVMLSDGELEHLLAQTERQILMNQADLDSYERYVTGQIERQQRSRG
jgi:hypothetical protein